MRITVQERLGGGANGTVYRGHDEDFDRPVAVKFFDNSFDSVTTQVTEHVAALKRINHPNVVVIYGVEELRRPGGAADRAAEKALIMEYVDGKSLGSWLAESRTIGEVRLVGETLLDAVDAFHRAGLPHGDLHSQNIRICETGAKLIDPMAQDPLFSATTANRAGRFQNDLNKLKESLLEILEKIKPGLDRGRTLGTYLARPSNVDELRAGFRAALVEPGPLVPLATAYDRLRECVANGKVVDAQNVRKEIFASLPKAFAEFRRSRPSVAPGPEVFDATAAMLDATENIWAWAIAVAESTDTGEWGDVVEIEQLLGQEWQSSGPTHYVNLPVSVFAAAYTYVLAVLLTAGHKHTCLRLLRTRFLMPRTEFPLHYWEASETASGIEGNDPEDWWKFLREGYARFPVLRKAFDTEDRLRTGLVAANLAIDVMACAASLKVQALTDYGVSPVWAHWMLAEPRTLLRGWRLVAEAQVAYNAPSVSGVELTRMNERWKDWATYNIGRVRRDYFGHTRKKHWWLDYPPGFGGATP